MENSCLVSREYANKLATVTHRKATEAKQRIIDEYYGSYTQSGWYRFLVWLNRKFPRVFKGPMDEKAYVLYVESVSFFPPWYEQEMRAKEAKEVLDVTESRATMFVRLDFDTIRRLMGRK